VAWVAIENLRKDYHGIQGTHLRAVDDLTLAVEEQEFIVIVGPSGCGKTTTLRLIAGLEDSTSGTISIAGLPMHGVRAKDRDVAMVFQNHALYPHLTAWENMAFGLQLRKFPKLEITRRVGEASEMLGLAKCLERRPEELSGGERQRVALGRAIVRKPKLFLFDEPLSNLDGPLRTEIRNEIARLHRQFQWTMIYVTHDQSEAMMLGHRMAVMARGKFQHLADPLTVYHTPANLFTAQFVGSPAMNLLEGKLSENSGKILFEKETTRIELPPTDLVKSWVGKSIVLGIRPENIIVQKPAIPGMNNPGPPAVVEFVEPLGPETHVHLQWGGCRLTSRTAAAQVWIPNEKVSINFNLEPLLLFDPATSRRLA
jgi:multiple sugar transport system ATP-binding protein